MENVFDLLGYHATHKPVEPAIIEKYQDILPEFLINEWKERDFSGYMSGLLITTNPEDYYDVLEGWVENPKESHVIMRTAFGSFYYLINGECYYRSVIHDLLSHMGNDFEIIAEFTLTRKNTQKDILQKGIYDKAFKRLGSPAYEEVYAFIPAIAFGGNYDDKTIQKVKLKEHLQLLAQAFS